MTKDQVIDLLNFLQINYTNFTIKEGMVDMWFNELQQYDEYDVKNRLKVLMSEEYYQKQPPLLNMIIKNLIPIQEKIDFTKEVYSCNICNRLFNDKEVYEKHFDRCSSVQYVIRESKRWFNQDLNKKELYEMSEDEFQERYRKLLLYIYEHTTDEREKVRIGFIFNPPSKERAIEYLGSGINR